MGRGLQQRNRYEAPCSPSTISVAADERQSCFSAFELGAFETRIGYAMIVESEIQTLFDIYLRAWNGRDFEGTVGLFTVPAVHVVQGGVDNSPDRAVLAANLRERFAVMESNGFDHAEIAAVAGRQCNDSTAMDGQQEYSSSRHRGR